MLNQIIKTVSLTTIASSEQGLTVRALKDGTETIVQLISWEKLKRFHFKEQFIDERGWPELDLNLLGVINTDSGNIYLDKRDTRFYTYDAEEKENKATVEQNLKALETEEYKKLVWQLLYLGKIGGLTQEVINKMMSLYEKKEFVKFKSVLVEACGLYSYVLEEESQFLERKSSLIHPAVVLEQAGNALSKQLDEITQTLVGAGNAREKDFHLIVGITDDGELTDNVKNELEKKWNGDGKKFVDMLTNRLCQIVGNELFVKSLSIAFITVKEHLLLDITVPKWDGGYLYCKNKFFIRIQATTKLVEGKDLVEYMSNFNQTNKKQ